MISFETPLPSPTPFAYEVQAGDTMSGIAFKFGVSLDELIAANPDISPNSMSIGTTLNIPSNPANPTGASTSTPVPAPVKQIECYPTADKGMWCFVLVHNDSTDVIENLSAQVTLVDASGQTLASAQALSPLNILPPGTSLPLMVFFPPDYPYRCPPPSSNADGYPPVARGCALLARHLAQYPGPGGWLRPQCTGQRDGASAGRCRLQPAWSGWRRWPMMMPGGWLVCGAGSQRPGLLRVAACCLRLKFPVWRGRLNEWSLWWKQDLNPPPHLLTTMRCNCGHLPIFGKWGGRSGLLPFQPHVPFNRHIDRGENVTLHIRLDQ